MKSAVSRQETGSGQKDWLPKHRSRMSWHIWRAFSSGRLCTWRAGEICYPACESPDPAYLPEFPSYFTRSDPPDWISALLARLDAALPGADAINACLDADSLTLDSDPAAFRMPQSPSPASAGACLAAARVLLACRDDLLAPVFISDREAVEWLEYASRMALMMGGEPAFLTALSVIGDADTFAVSSEAADIDGIEVED